MSHHHESFASHGGLDRRLWASAALNAAITLAEFVGGILSGSLALLSDAAHNLSDVVAIVLALMARRLGRRPPTIRHSYGLKRVEVVAALVNAVTLIAVTVLIAHQAVLRLLHPEPVAQGIMLVVALGALGANIGSALLLRQHDKGDVNVRGAFLHMAQDAVASLAVVVAALLARTGVGLYVDSVAALLVGLVVLRSALSLAWQTLSTILEGVPGDVDIVDLADRVHRAFAPARLHHIHVWELGPTQRLLTAHVTVGQDMSGLAIEGFLSRLKAFLHEQWEINHATIEPEVAACPQPELLGRWDKSHSDDQGNNGRAREGHVDDSAGWSHACAEFVDDRTGKKGRSAMYDRDYVYTKRMDGVSVSEVTTRVRRALADAGFGVLTEIDVQATLKKKLGVERKPYLILGACNPPLAQRALQAEPPIGVFLPCNVDIFEGDDGAVYVQTPKPTMMFGLVGNPSVRPIAEEVDAKLRQVLETLVA